MPAAAVIPAPIAYIKVVAVKKLVVEILQVSAGHPIGLYFALTGIDLIHSAGNCFMFRFVTLRKLECFEQA